MPDKKAIVPVGEIERCTGSVFVKTMQARLSSNQISPGWQDFTVDFYRLRNSIDKRLVGSDFIFQQRFNKLKEMAK